MKYDCNMVDDVCVVSKSAPSKPERCEIFHLNGFYWIEADYGKGLVGFPLEGKRARYDGVNYWLASEMMTGLDKETGSRSCIKLIRTPKIGEVEEWFEKNRKLKI